MVRNIIRLFVFESEAGDATDCVLYNANLCTADAIHFMFAKIQEKVERVCLFYKM